MWRATVVLPDDSGPNISITLPRGTPPTPNAISRAIAPLGITSMLILAEAAPSFIIEPFPNCRSICIRAESNAFCLSDNYFTLLFFRREHLFGIYLNYNGYFWLLSIQ